MFHSKYIEVLQYFIPLTRIILIEADAIFSETREQLRLNSSADASEHQDIQSKEELLTGGSHYTCLDRR